MVDVKQLKYFVVSADVGSFSEAARILYTTQSNVSKAIQALEKSVGARLCVRNHKGMELTAQGRHVYRYASRILSEMEALEDISNSGEKEWLRISYTPSSWFASRVMEYYNLHYEEHIPCQVMTDTVKNIMNRVRDDKDDVGFVFVLSGQKEAFQYEVKKHHLEFSLLCETRAMLFLGEKHPLHDRTTLSEEETRNLRSIQCYQDEFRDTKYWTLEDRSGTVISQMEVCMITNSDYVMERMMKGSQLVNISGDYLTRNKDTGMLKGIPLSKENGTIYFGYLKRENQPLTPLAQSFVSYIVQALDK